ncbi:MAG: hypothetical protein ACOH17_00985 [Cellulomonas sp.]
MNYANGEIDDARDGTITSAATEPFTCTTDTAGEHDPAGGDG